MNRYVLSLRDRRSSVATTGRLDKGCVHKLRVEPELTFLLHGYNVKFREIEITLLRLATMLPSVPGGIVATLWPGNHALGALGFPFEGDDADLSGQRLAEFLITKNFSRQVRVSFVAHSTGCRVAMRAAALLHSENYTIAQVCLMAAAIDADSLADDEEYLSVSNGVERVAVLRSRCDRVLKYAYPLGDLVQAFLFFEKWNSALGYSGPKRHERNAIPSQVLDHRIDNIRRARHGEYLPSKRLCANMESAASFADDVLSGKSRPIYP